MNCAHTTNLGAYVLGSLEPAERAAVDEHLLSCPTCAAELADLTGLPALLAGVDLSAYNPAIPSAGLYDRIAAATAALPRHRRRRLRLVAVAAAVIVLAGVGAGLGLAVHHRAPSVSASAGAVHITVTASAESAGTALKVTVEGLPEDEHCHLVAIARDGSRHGAGDWVATYAGRAEVTGSTDVPRADLASLVLLGTHGQPLVTVTL